MPETELILRHPASLLGARESSLSDLRPGDVAMCGYFCDNLAGGPAGARFLARQVRYFSEADKAPPHLHDLGDLNVFPLEPAKHSSAIEEQVSLIVGKGACPLIVGGDQSAAEILANQLSNEPMYRLSLNSNSPTPKSGAVVGIDLSAFLSADRSSKFQQSELFLETILSAIRALPTSLAGGAVFGLAPALDWNGSAETRLACRLTFALAEKLLEARSADT